MPFQHRARSSRDRGATVHDRGVHVKEVWHCRRHGERHEAEMYQRPQQVPADEEVEGE